MRNHRIAQAHTTVCLHWHTSGLHIRSPLDLQALPDLSWLGVPALSSGLSVAAFLAIAKATFMKDRLHFELHRGRLYMQWDVPCDGPPLTEGAVEVLPTPQKGNGAFATQTIPRGTNIIDYQGELLNKAEFFSRYPDGVVSHALSSFSTTLPTLRPCNQLLMLCPFHQSDYVMALDDEYALDAANLVAQTETFKAVHMNHSRTPNVVRFYDRARARVAFFASRDIQPGEELLFDYGRGYWRTREHLEIQ
jgi:hypothetical protein